LPDPDVVFVPAAAGWIPVSFQNSLAYRVAVHLRADSAIEVDEKEQADRLEGLLAQRDLEARLTEFPG
jgi:hypothetical protein